MYKTTRFISSFCVFIACGLLASAGSVLLTPLAAAPSVLFAFIAFILMLVIGRGTLQGLEPSTLQARNVLLIAFGGWFAAEFISTAANNQHWQNLDYPMRFVMGFATFWIIRHIKLIRFEIFFYAIAASAPVAAARASYQYFSLDASRATGWTNYPIYFGNFCVLMGLYMAIIVVTMRDKITSPMRVAFSLGIPLLIYSAFLSGSRSSWLGLLGLLVVIDWRNVKQSRLMASVLATVISVVIIFMIIPELHSKLRITEAIHDVHEILEGNFRSSIGDRLQMWKASLLMFWSSPVLGIGSGNFQVEIANLTLSGAVDIELHQGSTVYNQAHSEILDILASKGLLGFVAYFVLLILPFKNFGTYLESTSVSVKTFALMGRATIVAFFMFGLTLATFKVQIYCAIYPLTISIFMALALNLLEGEKNKSKESMRETANEDG